MALMRLRPPHAPGAELHREPVDEAGNLAFPGWLLDQALLRGAERLAPVRLQCKSIEAEFGIERRRLFSKQPLEMLRIATRDGGGGARLRNAAVDAKTAERQPPCAEVPFLQLPDEIGDQPRERLPCRFGVHHRLFKLEQRPRRRIGGGSRQWRRAAGGRAGRRASPPLPPP